MGGLTDSLGPDQDYIYNARLAGRQRRALEKQAADRSITLERGFCGVDTPTSITMSQVSYSRSHMLFGSFIDIEHCLCFHLHRS